VKKNCPPIEIFELACKDFQKGCELGDCAYLKWTKNIWAETPDYLSINEDSGVTLEDELRVVCISIRSCMLKHPTFGSRFNRYSALLYIFDPYASEFGS
jgi:hypothetical protein